MSAFMGNSVSNLQNTAKVDEIGIKRTCRVESLGTHKPHSQDALV